MSNEFWLCLHHLADSYRCEGMTAEERSTKIVEQFARMPAVARREVLADLAFVAQNINDVYVTVASEARLRTDADKNAQREARKGA